MAVEFPYVETAIEKHGVRSCCIATVGLEYENAPWATLPLGSKSCCLQCGLAFTLVLRRPERRPFFITPTEWARAIWTPDWQIDPRLYQPHA